jgi:hypothetical protein
MTAASMAVGSSSYFLPFVGPVWMLIECGILGSVDNDRYGLSPRMLREVFD